MNYHQYNHKSNTLWTIAIVIGLIGWIQTIFHNFRTRLSTNHQFLTTYYWRLFNL